MTYDPCYGSGHATDSHPLPTRRAAIGAVTVKHSETN